jgi:hypothetical protein
MFKKKPLPNSLPGKGNNKNNLIVYIIWSIPLDITNMKTIRAKKNTADAVFYLR